MDEEHRFLSAILGSPTDQALRLVYADWLEERGDPRGEFLRIQCQLDNSPPIGDHYRALQARAEELRALCPANWLAALRGPVWCVTANVVLERTYGPGGAETRRGTKHFAPGAKVHVVGFFWGMGGEQVTVVGRQRKSKHYITLTMRAAHLANWRAELVYSPAVTRQVLEYGDSCLPLGGEESQIRAEEIVAFYNQKGAVSQPFITRLPSGEPAAAPDRPRD